MNSASDIKKVIVIGELNPDIIFTGLRKFPVPGEEVTAGDMNVMLGSSSAIFAVALSRLGISVEMISKVGADFFSAFTIKKLEDDNVGTKEIVVDGCNKTGVTVSLSTPRDRGFITFLGSIGELSLEDIDTSIFRKFNHLHISSYFLQKELKEDVPYLFKFAKSQGLSTSLDTGFDPDNKWDVDLDVVLSNVDVFLPNNIEILRLQKQTSIEEAIISLSKICKVVVVKLGNGGAVYYSNEGMTHMDAFKVKTIDTTGAGDNFNAGFIYAFLNDMNMLDCLRIANACGSISTTKIGGTSASPTIKEVQKFLNKTCG